jgi:hypothetical protein
MTADRIDPSEDPKKPTRSEVVISAVALGLSLIAILYGQYGRYSAEEVWATLERYKEFITNGLDLISFLFITPELLRIARLTVNLGIPIIAGVVIASYNFVPLLTDLSARYGRTTAVLVGTALGAAVIAGLVRKASTRQQPPPPIIQWLSQHIFLIGLTLFFASRLFAFAIAAHGMLALKTG